jgi:hypothetical protein
MLTPDKNLIRAVERLIDGGNGHHHYATISYYKKAAETGDTQTFAQKEGMLRSFLLYRMHETAPDSWKAAINALVDQVNEDGAKCEFCGKFKLHGVRCKGDKKDVCWALREACAEHDGRCCKCYAKAKGEKIG